jgi:hypothetical protein
MMMRYVVGAAAGLLVAALFPPVADAVAGVLQPLAKAGMRGGHKAASVVMETASDASDTLKDLWAEAQSDADLRKRQANIVVEVARETPGSERA